MSVLLFRSLNVAAFGGIDANAVAFVNKWWHGNGHAIFQCRRFVYIGNRRTFHRRFGSRDGQFHRGRQIDADRRAFIKFRLNFQSRRQPLSGVAKIPRRSAQPARNFQYS